MFAVLSSDLLISDPSPLICSWAEEHLTLDNPEYIQSVKLGIGRHSGDGLSIWDRKSKTHRFVPRHICLYSVDDKILRIPSGCVRTLMEAVGEGNLCIDVSYPIHDRKTYASVPLFGYQESAVSECLSALLNPLMPTGGVLVGPCGCGKTRMGMAVIAGMKTRVLWLTHTHILLMQSFQTAVSLFGQEGLSVTTDGKLDIGSRITFATVQTLDRMDLLNLRDVWGLVIVDECHHCIGDAEKVRMFSHVVGSLCCPKLGLTATPDRADGLVAAMYALLGPQISAVTLDDVHERIVPVDYRPIVCHPDIDMSDCLTAHGTVSLPMLISRLCADPERNGVIVQTVRDAPKPCLILSSRLAHLDMLTALLPGSALLKKDRGSQADVTLATYQLVGEGYDRPELRSIVLSTPESDPTRIRQAVGRVMRIADGKAEGIVYDIVDDCDYRRWISMARKRASIIAGL